MASTSQSVNSPRRPSAPPRPVSPPYSCHEESPLLNVKKNHDKAYHYIEEGLIFDQQSCLEESLFLYEKGLKFLDRALNVRCDGLKCVGPDWDQARDSQQKMRRVRMKILSRINEIKLETAPIDLTSSVAAKNVTELPLDDEMMEGELPLVETPETLNAKEIFCIEHGVQLFYISPNGDVGIPSYPTTLKIYKFTEKSHRMSRTASGSIQPVPAFLQVGDWSYPLVQNCSPILHTTYGAYIFPNVTSQELGASVGILLPSEEIHDDQRNQFETHLQSLTGMLNHESVELQRQYPATEEPFSGLQLVPVVDETDQVKRPKVVDSKEEDDEDKKFSNKVSKGLVTGAEWISWGVTKGAEKTYHLVRAGASKLRARMKPEETPLIIDPRTQVGLQIMRDTSGLVVQVSSFLVDKLSMVTLALAKKIAPQLRKQGARLLSDNGDVDEGYEKMDAMMNVAMGGLRGAIIIYNSLEHAAILLARSIAEETVHTVQHKYGDEAGQAADNALSSVGNFAMATHNVRNIGVKAVAKRTAKDTSKILIEEHAADRDRRKLEKHNPKESEVSKNRL